MSATEIKEIIESGPGGKLAALLNIAYRFGGWVVMAIAACYAMSIVFYAYVDATKAHIDDLRTTVTVSSKALSDTAASNDRVADALNRWGGGKP